MSYELPDGGVFTNHLLHILQSQQNKINYNELIQIIRVKMAGITRTEQSPTLYGLSSGTSMGKNPWLNLHPEYSPLSKFYLVYNKLSGWVLTAGQLMGVYEQSKVQVSIDGEKVVLKVKEVDLENAIMEDPLIHGFSLSHDRIYDVYIIDQFRPIRMYFNDIQNDNQASSAIKNSLAEIDNLVFTQQIEEADFFLNYFQEHIYFSYGLDIYRPLGRQLKIEGESNEKTLSLLRQQILKLIQWNFFDQLSNFQSHFDKPPIQVNIRIGQEEKWTDITQSEIFLNEEDTTNSEQIRLSYQLSLTNVSNKRLYIGILSLSQDLAITSEPVGETVLELEPSQTKTLKRIKVFLNTEMEVYNWEYEQFIHQFIVYDYRNFAPTLKDAFQQGIKPPLLVETHRGEGNWDDIEGFSPNWGTYKTIVKLKNPNFNKVSGQLEEYWKDYQHSKKIYPFISRLYPADEIKRFDPEFVPPTDDPYSQEGTTIDPLSLFFDSEVDKWAVNKGSAQGVKEGMHVMIVMQTQPFHLRIEEVGKNRSWILHPEREEITLDLVETYPVLFLTYSKPLCIYLNDIDHEPEIQASAEEALGEILRLGYQVETPETANLFLNIFNELVYFSLPDQPFQPLGKQLNTLEETSNWEAELRQHILCLENFSYLRYLENVASRGASQELLIEIQLEGEENWQDITQEVLHIETRETSRYGERRVWRQRFQLRITNRSSQTQHIHGFSMTTEGEILSSPFEGREIELASDESQLIYPHTKSQLAMVTFEPYKEVYNWEYEERQFVFLARPYPVGQDEAGGFLYIQEGLEKPLTLEMEERKRVLRRYTLGEFIDNYGVYTATIRLKNPEYNQVSGELLEKEEAYFRNEQIAPFLNQLYPPEVLEKYARTPKRETISRPATQPESNRRGLRGVTRLAITSGNYLDDLRRARKFRQNRRRMPDKPIILAEGDSWFLYPFLIEDIVDHLINDYPLRSIAAAGDYIEEWYEAGQLFREAKEIRPKYIMLSGGGVDFFGPELENMVHEGIQPGSNAEAYLNEHFYEEFERVMRIFENIVLELSDYASIQRVFVHGYDYISVSLPENIIQSGNINRTLMAKGLPQPSDRRRLLRYMVDLFNKRLAELEDRYPLVVHLDFRGTLNDTQWYDEMHPNSEGARILADKYIEAINQEEQGKTGP